jgi:hypothetical protein
VHDYYSYSSGSSALEPGTPHVILGFTMYRV